MPLCGLGRQKPRHCGEMLDVARVNRDQLPLARRLLSRCLRRVHARKLNPESMEPDYNTTVTSEPLPHPGLQFRRT